MGGAPLRRYLEMIRLEEARRIVISTCGELGCLRGEERVPVAEALGRVASREVRALQPSPAVPCAAMDGFAVRSAATFGARPSAPVVIGRGDFLPVDTGSPVPPPFDAVVPVEEASEVGGGIEVKRAYPPARHVRAVGEDFAEGEVVVPEGGLFVPEAVAACISTGNLTAWVRRRPRLLFIPTGSELAPVGGQLPEGGVYETDSLIFRGYVERWGGEVEVHPIVPDDPRALEGALRRAVEETYDLICVCAGTSKGRGDLTAGVVSRLGEVLFHGIAISPGKPTLFGVIGGRPVLGLPGYPVSLWVVLLQLVRPLLEEHYGRRLDRGGRAMGRLGRGIHSPLGTREFLRVSIREEGGSTEVHPLPGGSGRLSSILRADAILEIPEDVEFIPRGTEVEVELIPPWG